MATFFFYLRVSGKWQWKTDVVICSISQGTDGKRVEKVLDAINISCNKFTCPGESSSTDSNFHHFPSGLRVGSPALTSRGLNPNDFETVCEFLDA